MTGAGKRRDPALSRAKHGGDSFDGFKLAARSGVIEGHVEAATLSRLADVLPEDTGSVDLAYRISGIIDPSGRPALEVSVEGSVPLTCQRCLRDFRLPVEQHTLVLLARDESELARLDDEVPEHEVVLADAPLDAVELVEDELLLTLPFAPRCPDDQCAALNADVAGAPPAAAKSSAFDALAALRPAPAKKPRRPEES